jgi:hypothetical protein
MIPGYLKTLREMNRRGAKGSEPLNALNALNAHPGPERPVAEAAVIDEYENADFIGRSAASFQTSTCVKGAISAKRPSPYQSEFEALERRCPELIEPGRWRQAVEDGRQFLTTWGDQAKDLGWTAQELFGLHRVPAKPHASFDRLSRYDSTGLVWLLHGRVVVKMTADSAAIRTASGRPLMYSKNNKPALGPFGDSLDGMGPI